MTAKRYRDLLAWQKAMDLVELVYRLTAQLPLTERFGLTSQLQRAAVSVPANIAEGNGRIHRKEYVHCLSIARGSLMELETHLTLTVRLKLLKREAVVPVWNVSQDVARLLNALITSLRKKENT
jgi:four helix bundle protein